MRFTRFYAKIVCCLGTTILITTNCSHKTDAKTELEKAATVLNKSEGAPAQPAPAPEPVAISVESAPASMSTPVPIISPVQQMQSALASYKGGELEDAVTRLQKLRASPTLTAEQRMAVQDGVAAVMTEIYGLAEKGDTKAIQAVKQYELMQTSRH